MNFRVPFLHPGLLVFVAALVFAGCDCSSDTTGSDTLGEDCETEADCSTGEICLDGTCALDEPTDAGMDADADDDPPDAGDAGGSDGDAGGSDGDAGGSDGDAGGSDGGGDASDAGTDTTDAGTDTDLNVDPNCSSQLTCEEQDAQCGWVPNGCGAMMYCGECGSGQTCGLGDDRGTCVESQCDPLESCDATNECGVIADGCGGYVECGTCGSGEYCNGTDDGAECLATQCEALTCADHDPGECGPHPDGCGEILHCGTCQTGEVCGTGNELGECLEVDCDPLTCSDYSPGECGPHPDGCGGTIDCGTCSGDQVCGTGSELGECVDFQCDELTCADYDDINCGYVSDGCAGVTANCGTCEDPEICGGGDEPNVCGDSTSSDDCVNYCEDQVICPDGGATALTGTVYAPNGTLPIPNATIYVPNDPLDELPTIESGPVCQQCEDEDLGTPLVGTLSDSDGTFELRHVPADTEFPLVIKIGQWRRVVMIDPVDECTTRVLTAEQTRLPTQQQEQSVHDNIPHTAITTGLVDAMECVFHKLGVDSSEFTRHTQGGRFHLYRSNGGVADQELADACWNNFDLYCGADDCTDRYPEDCQDNADGDLLRNHMSYQLYDDTDQINSYDMVVMDCEASEHTSWRTTEQKNRLRDYVNAGGRLFASHYAYDWLHQTDELEDTAVWGGEDEIEDDSLAYVDDTFFDGSIFWDWLQLVGADYPDTGPDGEPQIEIIAPRTYVQEVDDSLSTRWVYTDGSDPDHVDYDSIQQYTFDTPVYEAEDQQCGRVAYSAFHVANTSPLGSDDEPLAFPGYCGTDLTSQEKVLAYMLFDLSSCVTDQGEPEPPSCDPLTCEDVGAECGTASDGCGGTIDCGSCPDDQTCGAGGPNVCSGGCQTLTCEDHGAECGIVDDGCGDTLDCGSCAGGTTCGGGGEANVCGCELLTCEDHGAECGTVDDGCGGTLDCGDCSDGESCGGGGGEANVCGCEQLTCEDHGAECGTVDDGCGGTLDCGECSDAETCGTEDEPNICTCEPLSCEDHNAECGAVEDGCGNVLDCGGCPNEEEICDDLQCTVPECNPLGEACETDDDCCSGICAIDSGEDVGNCISP